MQFDNTLFELCYWYIILTKHMFVYNATFVYACLIQFEKKKNPICH